MGRRTVNSCRVLELSHQWPVVVLAPLRRYTIRLLRTELRLIEHSAVPVTDVVRSSVRCGEPAQRRTPVLHNASAAATARSDRSTLGR